MTDTPDPPLDNGSAASRYPLLARPHVQLSGSVDQVMYASFRDQLRAAPGEGALVISISTLGGDPEVARLMGDEIRLLRDARFLRRRSASRRERGGDEDESRGEHVGTLCRPGTRNHPRIM